MVLITIVTGAYKPTYNGGPHCSYFFEASESLKNCLDQSKIIAFEAGIDPGLTFLRICFVFFDKFKSHHSYYDNVGMLHVENSLATLWVP
jgi:hypothetical protein